MSRRIKIACLGDSVVYGYGIKENREELVWTALLEDLLNGEAAAEAEAEAESEGHHHAYPKLKEDVLYEVRNYGINGQGLLPCSFVSCRLDESTLFKQMIDWKPDALILHIGGNDYEYGDWNPELFREEFAAFAGRMASLCGRRHVCLLAPSPAYGEVGEIIMKEAEILGCDAIDLDLLFAQMPRLYENCPDLFADPEHPNEAGNEIIADVLYSIVGGWEFD